MLNAEWRLSVQVGDLVRASEDHCLKGWARRNCGLVIEHRERTRGFAEHLIVAWSDGDIEIELPRWLEIISESR